VVEAPPPLRSQASALRRQVTALREKNLITQLPSCSDERLLENGVGLPIWRGARELILNNLDFVGGGLGDWIIKDSRSFDEPLMVVDGIGHLQGYPTSHMDERTQPLRNKVYEIIKATIGTDCLWMGSLRAINSQRNLPISDFIREMDEFYFQISPEQALASCGIDPPEGMRLPPPPPPSKEQLAFGAAVLENFGRCRKRQGGACTVLDCELAGRSLHMAGLDGCNKRLRPRNLQFGGRGVGAAGGRRPANVATDFGARPCGGERDLHGPAHQRR
jgi:hypothetical protein